MIMEYINVQFTTDEFNEFILSMFAGHMLKEVNVSEAVNKLSNYIDDRCNIESDKIKPILLNCVKQFELRTGV